MEKVTPSSKFRRKLDLAFEKLARRWKQSDPLIIELHKKLISFDTVKVILLFTPIYSASFLYADEVLQTFFFDQESQRNINQFLPFTKIIYDSSHYVRFLLCALSAVSFPPLIHFKETSFTFFIGTKTGGKVKRFIRHLVSFSTAFQLRRPPNELFPILDSKLPPVSVPSGHVFISSFAAVLYSLRHHWKVGIPLCVFAGAIAISGVTLNRHYLSQTIAGACLGIIYGIAANKALNRNEKPSQRVRFRFQELWEEIFG